MVRMMGDSKEGDDKALIDAAERALSNEYEIHEEFNAYVDGEEPVSFPSPKDGSTEYGFEKSRILYWLDRDAYVDEKESWQNETINLVHKDCIEYLKEKNGTAAFDGMINAVRRKRIAPFVGAGLSMQSGLPAWGDALLSLKGDMPNLNSAEFNERIKDRDYFAAAQILYNHDPDIANNFIRTTFNAKELNDTVKLLPEITPGCVITTNLDELIEEVFRQVKEPFDGYMHGTQQNKFVPKLMRGERCILKLHGNVDDPATYIFTSYQYQDAYGDNFDFTKPLPKAFRQIYTGHSLLFLGCSLEQDKTLELFEYVKNCGEYEIPDHYAFLPEPASEQETQDKKSRLLRVNIQPIWYPHGKHEYVEGLLKLAIDAVNGKVVSML